MAILHHKKDNRAAVCGQTLIEAVIAIGVVVVVLVGLVSGTVQSLRNVRFARNQARATEIAQEAIEATRTVRDQDFALLTNGDHGLSWNGSLWSFSGTSDTTDIFTRKVTITDGSVPTAKQVTVTVMWPEGSDTKTISLVITLADI